MKFANLKPLANGFVDKLNEQDMAAPEEEPEEEPEAPEPPPDGTKAPPGGLGGLPPPPPELPEPEGLSNKLPCVYLEEPPPDGGFCLGVFLP